MRRVTEVRNRQRGVTPVYIPIYTDTTRSPCGSQVGVEDETETQERKTDCGSLKGNIESKIEQSEELIVVV